MTASITGSDSDSPLPGVISESVPGPHAAEHHRSPLRRRPIFLRRDRVGAFLSIALSGQLVYAAFEALKGSLMLQVSDVLGIGIDGFGAMMSVIGLAMYMYVPAGWINNRFTIRSILVTWCAWRLGTLLVLYLVPGVSFTMMLVIAFTWAVWDAIGWPAVVNGLTFISRDDRRRGRGMVMGFFEAIRRSVEFILAMVVVACVWALPQHWKPIVTGFAVGYSLLLVPLIVCLLRFVPRSAIAHQDSASANTAALIGLLKVIARPRIWLAGLAAMCLYWTYVNLIYSSAPYLKLVYNVSDGVAGLFGATATSLVGALICIPAGFVADYVFKSSTAMMTAALTVIAISAAAVYMLPSSKTMMWPAIILLIVMAVGVFMGKSVILAPIAELDLPEEINGSAMAVASFLAYASIIWGNSMTAGIVESHRHDAYAGYQIIFLITLSVALAGAACAFALTVVGRRRP
ncbi:MFS transporter [Actinomyces sp. ZJ308]|uniref:MFS transporter n=1 Tax=Actinomyces sp. ZJ308 TaxID=2708342 RepID=UPI0014249EFE|nr:MFS transporter [Actinomyces sp. ZJ308]